MAPSQSVPTLLEKHSGIPPRLLKTAEETKSKILALKTLPESVPRQKGLKLPPNTTLEQFTTAIKELKKELGDDAVELNDKPLVDGWYMEHP